MASDFGVVGFYQNCPYLLTPSKSTERTEQNRRYVEFQGRKYVHTFVRSSHSGRI